MQWIVDLFTIIVAGGLLCYLGPVVLGLLVAAVFGISVLLKKKEKCAISDCKAYTDRDSTWYPCCNSEHHAIWTRKERQKAQIQQQ